MKTNKNNILIITSYMCYRISIDTTYFKTKNKSVIIAIYLQSFQSNFGYK